MDPNELQRMINRVTQLERRQRRLVTAMVAVAVGAGIMIVEGTHLVRTPKELAAERFTMLDPDGQVRAEIRLAPDFAPEFVLRDERSQPLLTLRSDNDDSERGATPGGLPGDPEAAPNVEDPAAADRDPAIDGLVRSKLQPMMVVPLAEETLSAAPLQHLAD